MIFWDEMWNQSADTPKPTPTPTECCGKWDKLGTCNCKKNETIN